MLRIIFLWCFVTLLQFACSAQFANPFLNDRKIFTSRFERSLFLDLEKNANTEVLDIFFVFADSANEKLVVKSKERLLNSFAELDLKRHHSETHFLRYIFSHLHKFYLKKYQRYSTFDRLFLDGSYDCLTGTALYSLALNYYGFNYTIHETSLHSYIIVHTSKRDIMLESTDPLNGFIDDKDYIVASENKYSEEISNEFKNLYGMTGYKPITSGVRYYNESIDLKSMAGLHYYNQAVIDFNLSNFRSSVVNLEKAYTIYPSKRILNLLLMAIKLVLQEKNISKKDIAVYSGKTSYYTLGSARFFN